METVAFFVVAVFILAFTAVSRRIEHTVLTPAMVFVTVGLILGTSGLEVLELEVAGGFGRLVMELTLVLVLFTDASRIDVRNLRSYLTWPLRMLGIGLPLVVVAGTLAGVWILDLPLWPAAVLAVVLAPTDAALGEPILVDPSLPPRVRQTLNVESGLNDGIALPLLTVALALAGVQAEMESVGFWVLFAVRQIGLGIAAGVVVALVGGRLIDEAHRRHWSTRAYEQLSSLGIALVAFAGAELIEGNGFIAAFVAGLVMGNSFRPLCTPLFEFAEAEGQLLTLLTFLFFGAAIAGPALEEIDGAGILYVVASLTVVRVIPIAISLVRSGARPPTIALLGWFGPRGIASILFALIVADEALPDGELIFSVMGVTVLFSVFLHGISALPLGRLYHSLIGEEDSEMMPVTEMPMRSALRTRRPGA